MSRPLSLFAKPQEDQNSRLMKNLLAIHEQQNTDYEDHRPLSHRDEHPHDPTQPPKRPTSANPLKRRLKSANSAKFKSSQGNNNSNPQGNPTNVVASREDLVAEIYELKKKNLALEEQLSWMKTENQRLESEAMKQQRRIDQLLNLSDGVKSSASSQHVRKEIEKSILVRQLKNQLNLLKNVIAEKETEIDHLKRDMRSSHIKEVETERDEYALEVQRLLKVIENLKAELSRERRRREWNRKLAGETGDDLRRELARLTSGYQTILTNLSHKSHSSNPQAVYSPGKGSNNMLRPSSAGPGRSSDHNTSGSGRQRPQSANIRGKEYSYNNNNNVQNNSNNNNAANSSNKVAKMTLPPSPSDNWLESFNLENFGDNNNNPQSQTNPTNGNHNADKQSSQQPNNNNNQGDNILPSDHIFSQKGKPLSDYASMKPTTGPNNANNNNDSNDNPSAHHQNKADLEEDEDYEEGDEEELPSEKIPVFDHQSPPRIDYVHPAPAMEPISLSSPSQVSNPFITPAVHDEKLHQYHMMDEHNLHHHPPGSHPPPQSQFLPPQLQPQGPPMNQPKPLISHVMTTIGNAATILPPNHPLGPGDRVQAEYRGKGRWYDGVVKSFDAEHGTYYIAYDDGEEERGVLPIRVRLISKVKPDPKFQPGQKVEALYYAGSSWYKGTIKGAGQYQDKKESYVYEILYTDGEREKNVLEENIRLIEAPPPSATPAPVTTTATTTSSSSKNPATENRFDSTPKIVSEPSSSRGSNDKGNEQVKEIKATASKEPEPKYAVGERVEGCFAENNTWYRATIRARKIVNGDVLYDLEYDDGDRETGVVEAKVRLPPTEDTNTTPGTTTQPMQQTPASNPTPTAPTTPIFKVNDIIEAYYEEFENWFRGKIVAVHPSNHASTTTYHVLYDDGDEENIVFPDRIRYFQRYSGDYHFQYQIGDQVEARYKLGKEWYRGVIQSLQNDPDYGPVYDITYDDGDFETKVRENNMKLIKSVGGNKVKEQANTSSPRNPSSNKTTITTPTATTASHHETVTNSGSKSHIVTTNLDSFLNDLSDDEDEGGGGIGELGLDGGRAVTLKADQGMLIQEPLVKGSKEQEEDDYNEDFDA